MIRLKAVPASLSDESMILLQYYDPFTYAMGRVVGAGKRPLIYQSKAVYPPLPRLCFSS